jgi:hypothetical protein
MYLAPLSTGTVLRFGALCAWAIWLIALRKSSVVCAMGVLAIVAIRGSAQHERGRTAPGLVSFLLTNSFVGEPFLATSLATSGSHALGKPVEVALETAHSCCALHVSTPSNASYKSKRAFVCRRKRLTGRGFLRFKALVCIGSSQ